MSGMADGIIYGFGALNVDLIYRVPPQQVERLPYKPGYEYYADGKEGDRLLEFLNKEAFLEGKYGGGSAANTTVALSRMGNSCAFIGKIGRDEEGDFLLESLEDVEGEEIIREGKTGLCINLLLGRSKDRSLVIIPNANDTLHYEEIPLSIIYKKAKWIHLTSFCGDKPFEAQCRLIEELAPETRVSFDPGMLYARRGLEGIMPLLRRTNYFFPEKKEVELLTGLSYEEGSRKLLSLGPEVVLCTLGEEGVFVVHEEGEFYVPSPQVPVVDTTGAGDVFAAGFIFFILQKKTIEESVQEGVTVAAHSVTGVGRDRYPSIKNL